MPCLLLLQAGALSELGRSLHSSFASPAQPDKPRLNLQLSEQRTGDASMGLLLLSPGCSDALAELAP